MSRRKPTLSELDRDNRDDYEVGQPGSPDKGRPAVRTTSHRLGQKLKQLGGIGCWCGKPNRHDWPGKDEGKPHPRKTEVDKTTPNG